MIDRLSRQTSEIVRKGSNMVSHTKVIASSPFDDYRITRKADVSRPVIDRAAERSPDKDVENIGERIGAPMPKRALLLLAKTVSSCTNSITPSSSTSQQIEGTSQKPKGSSLPQLGPNNTTVAKSSGMARNGVLMMPMARSPRAMGQIHLDGGYPFPRSGTGPFPMGECPLPLGMGSFPLGGYPFPLDKDLRPTGMSPYPTVTSPYPTGTSPLPLDASPLPLDASPLPLGGCPLPLDACPLPLDTSPLTVGDCCYNPHLHNEPRFPDFDPMF